MERKKMVAWGVSMALAFGAGYGIKGVARPADQSEKLDAVAVSAIPSVQAEEPRLQAVLAELANAERALEAAGQRLHQLQRKANRYDWLCENGLHNNYSLSFNRDTFEPPQALLDFLGLEETDAAAFKQMAVSAFDASRSWEAENAVCVADTASNCVYEIDGAPEALKQDFVSDLSSLLPADDLEMLAPIIDSLYENAAMKRSVAVTFIPSEEYVAQQERLGKNIYGGSSDRVKLEIKRFGESGNQRGSSSSTFSLDQTTLEHSWSYKRWNHLFDLGAAAQ
jgi:hypothetical protein